MNTKLLWIVIVIILAALLIALSPKFMHKKTSLATGPMPTQIGLQPAQYAPQNMSTKPYADVEQLLHQQAPHLREEVIQKAIMALTCANEQHVDHRNILTVVDFSLPSNEKRLWIFDLEQKKILFNTYVSHGIKSGTLLSRFFSNKYNSKASSLGIFRTEKPYYGRHGSSLQLAGLEYGFNDNAAGRAIVLHGGWYVEERFIKKYGRAGRSWGCPAVPSDVTDAIINTIKDQALFVAYYPSDFWLSKSRFLNCKPSQTVKFAMDIKPLLPEQEVRDDVLLVNVGGKGESSEAVVTMTADNYARIFNTTPPLGRMLRRQIDNVEYIALSNKEFNQLITSNAATLTNELNNSLTLINFVSPQIKMQRGYYATEMKIINLGKIKEARANTSSFGVPKSFTVYFESNSAITLHTTDRFIRWLGL